MTIEIALLLSIISVASSVYFAIKSSKRNDTSSVEQRVREQTTINVKLDEICSDVKDIKYDISTVKKDVNELDKKISMVEQSVKSAHHRIDELTPKGKVSSNESE